MSDDKYAIGREAEKLLSNDAFIEALANIRGEYFERFCSLSHDDVERMKSINIAMIAIDKLESELKDLVITGNNAKKQLEK